MQKSNPFRRKNQHSVADANAQVQQGKTHKQPSHAVEGVAKMAGDSHRQESPKPSTSTAGDRRYAAPAQKPRKGVRKSMEDYGEASKLSPWDKIRYLSEQRESEMKSAFLKSKCPKK